MILHTERGKYRTAGPLKKLEEELAPFGFSKCHNAYLVNLQHAGSVLSGSVQLTNGEELPISRARKKPFMDALTDYVGGMQR